MTSTEIRGKLIDLRQMQDAISKRRTAIENELGELHRAWNEGHGKVRALEAELATAEHAEAGLCAAVIHKGQRYYTSDVKCQKRRKDGDRFCGTHRRSMTLRGVL